MSKYNIGWAKIAEIGFTLTVTVLGAFYAMKQSVAVIETRVMAQECRIEKVENKCDSIGEIRADVKFMKELMLKNSH